MIGTLLFWLIWVTGLAIYVGIGTAAIYVGIDEKRRQRAKAVFSIVTHLSKQRDEIKREQQPKPKTAYASSTTKTTTVQQIRKMQAPPCHLSNISSKKEE